jgi:hypothetical protein
MDGRQSATDEECSEEAVLRRCGSRVSGQIAAGIGTAGHGFPGKQLLRRFILSVTLVFSLLALLIPLASC